MSYQPSRDQIVEVIFRALVRHDREKRSLRSLRLATGGQGPTIKRGTARSALAIYLADVVLAEFAAESERPE